MTGMELRRRRKLAGLSQADLATQLGLSRDYIGLMERGKASIAPRTATIMSSVGANGMSTAPPRKARTSDPMERMVELALIRAGIDFETDHGGGNKTGLDFYLPQHDVYIEVKRFHSDRIGEQMKRAPNVIALQGETAIRFFCDGLSRSDLAYRAEA